MRRGDGQGRLLEARDVIGQPCKVFLLRKRSQRPFLGAISWVPLQLWLEILRSMRREVLAGSCLLSATASGCGGGNFAHRGGAEKRKKTLPCPRLRPLSLSTTSKKHAHRRRCRKRTLSIAPLAHPQVNCLFG